MVKVFNAVDEETSSRCPQKRYFLMTEAAQAMQHRLNEVYDAFKKRVVFSEEQARSMSPPLLLQVSDRWATSPRRLLVVGQETKAWDFSSSHGYYEWPHPDIATFADYMEQPEARAALVEGHRIWDSARILPTTYNGYTWRAFRQMRQAMGDESDGFESSTLMTNLFRMDFGGESALCAPSAQLDELAKVSGELLREEIAVLQPTDMVFITGPYYEPWLEKTFEGIETLPFKDYDPSRTAMLRHPELPARTWRTYHPGYLSRGNWHIVDDICTGLSTH